MFLGEYYHDALHNFIYVCSKFISSTKWCKFDIIHLVIIKCVNNKR